MEKIAHLQPPVTQLFMSAALITSLGQFGLIPAADHPRIIAAWQPRTVFEGDFLARIHGICQELFFIEQGVLRIVMQPLRGKVVTHSFLREHQFSTILAGFNNREPTATGIQAACPTQVLAISRSRLDTLCEQLPYLSALLTQLIQRALLDRIQTRQMYMGQDAATNYRLFLQREADIAPKVPQHMIASYLGITPQSLSRLRKVQQ